ncbi:MAG: hypothetical protein JNN20_00495 [Betaproteobacteria bacterium]|nr:hypothetical protein [Betaproteobacteria bacterium]
MSAAAKPRAILLPHAPALVAVLLLLSFVAFWVPYFSQLSVASRYVHFHVATMLVWMCLLIVQPLLMRAGRRDVHRAIGKTTWLLMPLVLVSSVLLAHFRISQPGAIDQPGMLQVLILQMFSPLLLAGFYAAALMRRREPAVHARWMLATALPLIDPVIARVLAFHLPKWADAGDWLGPLIAMATLAIIIVAERQSSRGRHVFPIVFALVLLQLVLFYTLGTSAVWRTFAQWFAALPLS